MFSTSLIIVAGIVGMIGAGVSPVEGRAVGVAKSSTFFEAFLAVTNPVSWVTVSQDMYLFPTCRSFRMLVSMANAQALLRS